MKTYHVPNHFFLLLQAICLLVCEKFSPDAIAAISQASKSEVCYGFAMIAAKDNFKLYLFFEALPCLINKKKNQVGYQV